MSDQVKVYKVELLIIDSDELGDEEIKMVIENVHYPNHCIAPKVMDMQARTVEWDDDHPLNHGATQAAAYHRLFGAT